MYELLDRHTMKKTATDEIFTHNSPLFTAFVEFCNGGGTPINRAAESYDSVSGIYKGKTYYRLKLKDTAVAVRVENLIKNLYTEKGTVINQLCTAVIAYMTGKNDETLSYAEVDAMIAEHGSILALLTANRHTSAYDLIINIVPDSYVTLDDKNHILSIYAFYNEKLTAISGKISKLKE